MWDGDDEDEQKIKRKKATNNDENTDVHQDIPSGRCCVASTQLLLRYS